MFHGGYLNFVPTQVWEPIWSDVDAEEGDRDHLGSRASRRDLQSYGTPVVPISPQVKSVLERLRENWEAGPYHPKNPKAVEAK